MSRKEIDPSAILFEFHQVGSYMKVTAIHQPTLTEVSIVGSPTMPEAHLKSVALRKLTYVLDKRE